MSIREATHHDKESIWTLANQFRNQSKYSDSVGELDLERVGKCFERVINGSEGTVFLLERNGKVRGFLALWIYPHLFSGETIASEIAWWVDPKHRGGGVKLLKAAERWATEQGAKRFHMIAPDERVAKFYERMGFEKLETQYQKDL